MAAACPRISAEEMQYVVLGSVQSSPEPAAPAPLQRKSCHVMKPMGGVKARLEAWAWDKSARNARKCITVNATYPRAEAAREPHVRLALAVAGTT
jgi:hypothetical protein